MTVDSEGNTREYLLDNDSRRIGQRDFPMDFDGRFIYCTLLFVDTQTGEIITEGDLYEWPADSGEGD